MSGPIHRPFVDEAAPAGMDIPLLHGVVELARLVGRRKWWILATVAISISLGAGLHSLQAPTYVSQAQLLVERTRPRVLPIPGVAPQYSVFQDSLGPHQTIIQSPLIVEEAVRIGELDKLESLAEQRDNPKFDPVKTILAGLQISRRVRDPSLESPYSTIFIVSYRCGNADDCKTILRAVVDSYRQYLARTERRDSDDVRELYRRWKEDIQQQLKEKRAEYEPLLNRIQPYDWKGENGVNLSEKRVADIASQRLDALLKLSEAKVRLHSLEKARQEGVSNEVLFEMVSGWTKGESGRMRSMLFEMLLEEKALTKKYGPTHREVRAIRDKIKVAASQVLGRSANVDDVVLMDPVEMFTQALKQEALHYEDRAEALEHLIQQEHVKAKEAHILNEKMDQVRADIDGIRRLDNEVIRQLHELDAVGDSDVVQLEVLSPPRTGVLVPFSRGVTILLLFAALGLGLGGGLACLAEMLDHRFRSPRDVEYRLQVPVVGHIPFQRLTRKATRAGSSNGKPAPTLVALSHPHSVHAEAYRGLRTALLLTARDAEYKIIQVTSPNRGNGKTTLTANLAVSVAQSAKRVVVVGADLRRPNLHKLFGISGDVGLANVLAGELELADAIQDSTIPGLQVLPSGTVPGDHLDLASSPRWRQLLDCLRQHADLVLLDSPPLLAVSDPCVLAAQVDGVLLLLRNGRHAPAQAARALEMLRTVRAHILGVVVKGAGPGGYHYERHRRDAGYSYTPPSEDGGLRAGLWRRLRTPFFT